MTREIHTLQSRLDRSAGYRMAVVALVMAIARVSAADETLRVMTYNIWVGGTQYGQPLSRTVGVIQAAQADVVGLQEQGGSGPAIAAELGFNYYNLGGSTAILSRYPITQGLGQGVKLQLSPTQEAYIFDVHLTPYPYQPYDIRDGHITTEAQAIASAQATRSASSVLSNMSSALASGNPVFLAGDFNEPSHLDWTQEAALAGLNFGMKVNWPTSRSVTNAGLMDAFRQLRPDEVLDRGETWTPGYPAPNLDSNEVHDRIDFVYYKGTNVTPISAQTLGYDANDGNTDFAIQPYPSDHRAVVVEFDMPSCLGFGDLNGDCATNTSDWVQFRTWQHSNMTGLTPAQAFARGDMNGDFKNNHADFVMFKAAYEMEHGSGAFVAMLSAIPEPSSVLLAGWAVFGLLAVARRR
jgi:endonuclease/exonuclease/phosphatase family metal-dependent hydrolase